MPSVVTRQKQHVCKHQNSSCISYCRSCKTGILKPLETLEPLWQVRGALVSVAEALVFPLQPVTHLASCLASHPKSPVTSYRRFRTSIVALFTRTYYL